MRTRTIIAATLACLTAAAVPAAAENSSLPFTDPTGDVRTQPDGVFYIAPDIVGGQLVFTDGADATRVEDDVLGLYATVDAQPSPGILSALFEGDYLGFWLNTDNNSATGSTVGTAQVGADTRIVVAGITGGQPNSARVDNWTGTAWTTVPVPVTVLKVNGDQFAVLLTPSAIGIQRGRPLGVLVVTSNETNGTINDQDFAPNTPPPFSLPIPALGTPPPPVVTVQAPAVATTQARVVGTDRATLAGTVDPRGAALEWYFEWGPTTRYGRRTAKVSVPAGQTGVRPVTAAIARLKPGTRFHYRLVVEPVGGAPAAGANISLRTANVDRLVISADPDGVCQGGVCRITGFSVVVRARDGDTNRPLRLTAKGLTAKVRCLSGCSVNRTFRLTGRNTMRAEIGGLLAGRSLPSGARLEVRVTGPKYVGALYRATFSRDKLTEQVCEIRAGGRLACSRA